MGSKFTDDDDVIADINITPFVDVVLVIMIIFIVTATTIVSSSIKADLPDAVNAESTDNDSLGIELTLGGGIEVDGTMTDIDGLRQIIRERRRENPELVCLVAAHKGVAWGRVVWLVDNLKAEGQAKYAFNIDKATSIGPDPKSRGDFDGDR